MSVDVILFAEKSKTCIALDRSRYILNYSYQFDNPQDKQYDEILSRLQKYESVNLHDLMYLLKKNLTVDQDVWNYAAMRFAETRPDAKNEIFKVLNDSDSPYSHDYAKENGYTFVDFNDPRKPYVKTKYIETRTPEQIREDGIKNRKIVEDLCMALEAGTHHSTQKQFFDEMIEKAFILKNNLKCPDE